MIPSLNQPKPPLIKTKLSVPQRRSSLVPRPRLLNLLTEGITRKLTLICAPPGYGKTTLITEWMASLQLAGDGNRTTICWLSLDAGDNDPTLFSSYLVNAIENARMLLSEEASAILKLIPPPPFQTVLSLLINYLDDHTSPICLVLDDYQFITNQVIHEGLVYFLDRLPATLHLMIATRSDPPLPLARLRAHNQLIEIRAEDLRFTPDEASAFLTQVMNLPLSSVDISTLETRTEGWIAGLQMAALSMRGREDVGSFIRAFVGTNRFILDFMLEEVLARETEEVQTFLLQTAILSRLTGPLCDALTGATDGQEMLERLERRNLFIVPLDDDRRWYRYHHLFADLLKARLYQSGPERVARLLSCAAEWCEQEGQVAEAIRYALAADNKTLVHLGTK